jgi:arylsulfatase A-like enzyme/Flp pilus assembly protein TadD
VRSHSRAAFLALPLALGCTGCGTAPPPGSGDGADRTASLLLNRAQRDVLLVTIDTLRADATGFSGAGKVETPLLDRIASGGVVFDRTHAHAVVTLVSHASILTGLYPYQHGARDNGGFVVRSDVPTLATILEAAGYDTAAFVSGFPLDRRFGLSRGFDVYDDAIAGSRMSALVVAERRGEDTVAAAKAWWDAHAGRRRFLWVHLFAPHFPYEPPEPFASRYRSAPYYGEAALADRQLQPLLDPILGASKPGTVVVVTSDHGESLGEHGEATHGLFAYEATLKVPLVIWSAGLLRPGRSSLPARHVDLLPTILDLTTVAVPPGVAGKSLFAKDRGEQDGSYFESLSAYFNRGWAPLQGWIENGRKAIRLPIPELYDLERDPGERENLASKKPADVSAMLAKLSPSSLDSLRRDDIDPETVARLRSLGYLASGDSASPPRLDDPATDPKNLIQSESTVDRALSSFRSGNVEEAIRILRDLVARQPRMSVAYAHLSFMLGDVGRTREAIDVLGSAIAHGAGNEEIRVKLALLLLRDGQADRGWKLLAGDSGSLDPETQSALGRLAAATGNPGEAERRFRRALELDPSYPEALVDLGILGMDQGRVEEAEASLERALAQDASLAEGWNALGVLRLRRGDPRGAIAAWRKAVEADPRLPDALFNLGFALGKSGEYSRASEVLRRYVPLVTGADRARAEAMLRELQVLESRQGPRARS